MEKWLTRSFDRKIKGPYTLKQIHDLISKGELRSRDEVCKANGFWFRLNDDPQTLREQLQIDPLQDHFLLQEEEITEISQQTATLKMDTESYIEGNAPLTYEASTLERKNEIEHFTSYPLEMENTQKKAENQKKLTLIFLGVILLIFGTLIYFYYFSRFRNQ